MEEYLSFHKVLDLLQQFQENNPRLNSFGYGNLVDFGKNVSGTTVVYPFLFIVPLSIQYDQNTTTYQLTAIFADRLNEDLSNEKDCVSDMSLCARQLLSEILRGSLFNYFETTLPAQAQPFMERFNDNVAGVALDLYVQIIEDINACPQYPTVTPTMTPSATPGQSPTPTPSVTPTITITPSITPTITITPSVTATMGLTPTPSVTPSSTPSVFTGLTFTVGSGSTRPESCNNLNSGNTITVYAADLGNCGPCLPLTCWPCVSTSQQVYLDQALTIPVPNGYYANLMQAPSNIGVWYIVGGFPQPAGFGGCA